MSLRSPRKFPLGLEQLENRLTPAVYGQDWLNPQNLTISFVPNGASVGNVKSSLDFLGKGPNQGLGQAEILRAFQTWAVNANLNIGLVAEQSNFALGTPGLIQGDSRFGDFRIAGSSDLTPDVVATSAPFNWSLGTSSGDVVFNTNQNLGINPTGTGSKYDLFSLALHEAGHVFGFADETTDPTSVMFADYQGPLTGLSVDDVANLRVRYGAPVVDAGQGNGAMAGATPVALSANTIVNGNLTSIGQAEYFAVTVPAQQKLVVTLHTAGYSLLAPTLSVFDANGNLLKSDVPDQTWLEDASVRFGTQSTANTYYIQVASAASNVFAMGGFQLEVGNAAPPNLRDPKISQDKLTNNTLGTATVLSYSSAATNNYSYYATMKDTDQSHFYQLAAPPVASGSTEAMLVSVMSLQSGSSAPGIHLYNQNGVPQAFQVLVNDGLNFIIQVPNVTPGAAYYVQTTQQSPSGRSNPTDYHLYVNFANKGAALASAVASNTLSQAKQSDSGQMVMAQAALVHFALAAQSTDSSSATITMTVTDAAGKTVFTLTATAGQAPVTLNYYLGAGAYSVTYKVSRAAGQATNSPIPAVMFELDAGISSDPQGPLFTSSTPVVTSGSDLTYNGTNTGGVGPYYY